MSRTSNQAMSFEQMVEHEPRLRHIESSCRRASQQAANWHDWLGTHLAELMLCVGVMAVCPILRRDAHWRTAYAHLVATWRDAMDGPPEVLPWDSRPLPGECEQTELFEAETCGPY